MKNPRVYSIVLVKKVMQVLLEKGEMGRTGLSQAANVQYARLMEQLAWLEERQYIELVFNKRKVVVRLTEKGREYGGKLLDLDK